MLPHKRKVKGIFFVLYDLLSEGKLYFFSDRRTEFEEFIGIHVQYMYHTVFIRKSKSHYSTFSGRI